MHVSVDKNAKTVTINLTVLNCMAAFRASNVTFPFNSIEKIEASPQHVNKWNMGIRVGTGFPGVLTAGDFHHTDGRKKDFYYIGNAQDVVAFYLKDQVYGIVGVHTPEEQTPEEFKRWLEVEIGL